MGARKAPLVDPVEHLDAGGPAMQAAYAYVLGQYLGDGHLVTSARVPVLRIHACTHYPGIVDEIRSTIVAVRGRQPGLVRDQPGVNMVKVQSYWMGWSQLLPQHGPGMKHTRPIDLREWQEDLVSLYGKQLIRGLIHSDGCRIANNVTVRGKRYSYPRYFLSNESADILRIMGQALDREDIPWRLNRPNSISIARREGVARLDEFVGPKT